MSFTRSSSALYGIHRFFGVDVVVYCEGGAPVTYQEAVSANRTDETLDTFYWSSLVATFESEKKFHFKSVGSKAIIHKIAKEINDLNLTNVSICRDSDYDKVTGNVINCPRT